MIRKIRVPIVLVAIVALASLNALCGDQPPIQHAVLPNPSLLELQIERAHVVAVFGESHPLAKQLDARIELIAKLAPLGPAPEIAKITDTDLRLIIQNLLHRVDSLEREVAELKTSAPKTNLLGK